MVCAGVEVDSKAVSTLLSWAHNLPNFSCTAVLAITSANGNHRYHPGRGAVPHRLVFPSLDLGSAPNSMSALDPFVDEQTILNSRRSVTES